MDTVNTTPDPNKDGMKIIETRLIGNELSLTVDSIDRNRAIQSIEEDPSKRKLISTRKQDYIQNEAHVLVTMKIWTERITRIFLIWDPGRP